MKVAFWLLLAFFVIVKADHHHDDDDDDDDDDNDKGPDGEIRLCPKHYIYIGDDEPMAQSETKDILYDEADRSPTYSCYRIITDEPKDFLQAAFACEEDNGHLISLDNNFELQRLTNKFVDKDDSNLTILLSALFIQEKWVWMGSNNSFDLDTTDFGVNASKQCLSVSMIEHEDKLEVEFVTQLPFHKPALKAVSCFDKTNYACELRVQTVTYFAWFVANWFSVLLVFLVIVLLISLCISGTMYSRRPGRFSGRVYRSSGPVFDEPPSYNRATGTNTANRYMNKGREFLANVIISRPNNSNEKQQLPQ